MAALLASLPGPPGDGLRSALGPELSGEDGPTGPKTKASWEGAPDA